MARTVSGHSGAHSPQTLPADADAGLPAFGARQELGRRETLEDRLHVAHIRTAGGLPLTVAMIADGVGGAAFGERAAELAIEAAFQTFVASLTADARTIPLLLRQGLEQAQRAVLAEQRADKAKRDMGTTAVAVALHNNALYVANVGDSRAYLMRAGKLHQLTRDHSWGMEMLREGLLRDADEAARHPKANELYRSVGEEENFKVDLGIYLNGVEQEDAATANQGLPLLADDRLLICSDGLVRDRPTGGRYIDDEEIIRILNTRAPDAAAAELVERAIGRRADDNVSAIVLEMPGSKRAFALPSWSRYAAIGAGALLLIAAALFLLLRNPGDAAPAAGAPSLPTMAPSTVAAPVTLSDSAGNSEDVRVIENGVATASGWPLLDDGTPAVIASGIGGMQLRFGQGSDL
jgi:protein phosphatase